MKKLSKIVMIVMTLSVFVLFIKPVLAHSKCEPRILSPNKKSVWHEGKTYTIRWKGLKEGIICIRLLLGGHEACIINNCSSCALENQYRWKIPIGCVTGFGVNKIDVARIVIYYRDNVTNAIYSDYFTIEK